MSKVIIKPIKISFFGPSGSGKSTAANLSEEIFEKLCPQYWFHRCDVASPLHRMQRQVYGILDLECNGQDGELLQFLANKFESHIVNKCVNFVDYLVDFYYGKVICVNSDCRNNAYQKLKDNGFIFVRVKTKPSVINKRLGEREDITKADQENKVEAIDEIKADYSITNNGNMKTLKKNVKETLKEIVENND